MRHLQGHDPESYGSLNSVNVCCAQAVLNCHVLVHKRCLIHIVFYILFTNLLYLYAFYCVTCYNLDHDDVFLTQIV